MKLYQTLIAAAVIYLASAAPLVGDVIGFLLIPFLAPVLLTLAMAQMAFAALMRSLPVGLALVPLAYFGFGAVVYWQQHDKVAHVRSEVAAFNAAQPKIALPSRLRSLTLVDCDLNPEAFLQSFRLDQITSLESRTKSGRRYTLVSPIPEDLRRADSANDVFYSRLRHPGGVTTVRESAATSSTDSLIITCPKDRHDAGTAGLREYEIAREGQASRVRGGFRMIKDGLMFPLVMRGPEGGGGTSYLRARLMADTRLSLDPDGLSPEQRIGRNLGLPPQDFTRFD